MKTHLLRCSQKAKITEANSAHTKAMQQQGWLCKWGACNITYQDISALDSVTSHLQRHLSRTELRCEWDNCQRALKSIVELHLHLETDHGVYTEATVPTHAEYCFECGIWTSSKLEWSIHGVHHSECPKIIYGPVTINGLLAEAGRCPYCLKDGLYRTIEKPWQYLQHVERHMAENAGSGNFACPHFTCESRNFDMDELREHFSIVHHIPFV
jgi:hypothetical protein